MRSRLDLQAKFEEILDSPNVYFQPPTSVKMRYPAIVYSRKVITKRSANNSSYIRLPCFEVVLIDKNPDSEYVEAILQLPYCEHIRSYPADNLNHDVFTIYNY